MNLPPSLHRQRFAGYNHEAMSDQSRLQRVLLEQALCAHDEHNCSLAEVEPALWGSAWVADFWVQGLNSEPSESY